MTDPQQLSAHFRKHEFTCHCCGSTGPAGISTQLLVVLEDIRKHFDAPVHITSGYRCPAHNAAVGGTPNSQHMKGTASDIRVEGATPYEVASYAESGPLHGMGGVGRYRTFTHVDVRDGGPDRWHG